MKYHKGEKDSYYQGTGRRVTPVELVEIIKKTHFNRYNGGKIHDRYATIDYYKPGYLFKNWLVITEGSKKEFQKLEELIYSEVDYFTSRKF